jgi:hypothetical protein
MVSLLACKLLNQMQIKEIEERDAAAVWSQINQYLTDVHAVVAVLTALLLSFGSRKNSHVLIHIFTIKIDALSRKSTERRHSGVILKQFDIKRAKSADVFNQ